jgi:hypothetical protein
MQVGKILKGKKEEKEGRKKLRKKGKDRKRYIEHNIYT